MELTKVLVLFAAAWTISLTLPVPVYQNIAYKNTIDLEKENRTVFERIEMANKGVIRPLSQGDIAFKLSRSSTKCNRCLWPASKNGTVFVPYTISSEYSAVQKLLITNSIKQIELMTCVKFIERSSENDFLSIESGEGCWSYVGKQYGKQVLSLAKSACLGSGIIQHELMHSLGFYHEQSRSDRDSYVDINWQYINEEDWYNFKIENNDTLDIPYDYKSVMHYQNTAFTNTTGKPTIVPKPDPTVSIGQSIGMNYLDVIKLNKLYYCNVCRMKLSNASGSFSSDDIFGQDSSCIWFIETEPFKMVHLQLSGLNIPSSAGCSKSYIKVYDGNSKSSNVLLDKTCGDGVIPPLISSANNMLVEFVHNQGPALSRFTAKYKTVSYGGTLLNKKGIVFSPSYAALYPSNLDAEWSIIAPPLSKVYLDFYDFWVQECPACSCDSLAIIDGPSITSSAQSLFCGSDLPPSFVSSGNMMVLKFHSDNMTRSNGFIASYYFESEKLTNISFLQKLTTDLEDKERNRIVHV
ncbi:astacin-like metalloendopeptidase [Pelobates fuscus]|uniref:astacin-like metalloendopeptidase n=1 Tax=Pelobates fuscus TaxID=191477 RepID=UPI002FE4CB27